MSSEVKRTFFVGLLASLLAAALVALVTHLGSASSLLGWAIFLELLQLPIIARRGSSRSLYRMAPTPSPGEVSVIPDDRQRRNLGPRIRSGRSLRPTVWFELLAVAAALLALSFVAWHPAVARAIQPALLIAAVVAAAGPLIAIFGGMLRDLGELERRIVSEALCLAFVATLSAMFAYPFLEGLGLPALRPQIVAFVLVSSFGVGVALFSRSYQ